MSKICSLTDKQKGAVMKITRDILVKNKGASVEDLLRHVYDVSYHLFVEGQKVQEPQLYALAATTVAAEVLDTLVGEEKANEIFSALGLEGGTPVGDASKYTHELEARKLLGLETRGELQRNLTKFSKEDQAKLNEKLRAIKDQFPKLSEVGRFQSKHGAVTSTPALLRVMEGGQPYFHISVFSKGQDPRTASFAVPNPYLIPEGSKFEEALLFGNMVDYGVRAAFRNRGKSFAELRELLLADTTLLNSFSAYSTATHKVERDPKSSPTFNAYYGEFVDDLLLTVSKIETEYKGYYLTDLTDLLDNSKLSKEERDAFYIYSNQLGLIGELDLLAIKPDGTFRVVDIKTTKQDLSEKTQKAYQLQISAYTHVLAEVTGLTPEGEADVFVVEKTYRPVLDAMKQDPVNNRRKVSFNFQNIGRLRQPVLSREEVAAAAAAYRAEKLEAFQRVDTVENSTPGPKFNRSWISTVGKPRNKPLSMELVETEPLSTQESLKLQAEWLERIFPELAGRGIQIVPSLAASTGGQFFVDAIRLAERSNEGVGYHEGWHRFSQLYLTKEEKLALYGKTRGLKLDFTDRKGNKLNTETASLLQLEEFLAEEFRKYALHPDTYTFPSKTVKGLFAKIWAFLRQLLAYVQNGGVNSYERLFEQLYTGTFYKGNYAVDNAIFSTLNSFFRDSKNRGETVMGNGTFLQYRDYADAYLSVYLENNTALLQQFLSEKGINELKKLFYEEFTAYQAEVEEGSDLHGELTKVVDAFDDFFIGYLKTTQFETIRQYINSNYKLNVRQLEDLSNDETTKSEDEPVVIEENEDDKPEGPEEFDSFNKGGNEKHPWDEASNLVKDFFNGIPKVVGFSEDGDLITDTNATGLPLYLHKKQAFAKTLELLEGRFTWELIQERLNDPAAQDIFPELRFIRERLIGEKGLYTRRSTLQREIAAGVYEGQALYNALRELDQLNEFTNQFKSQLTVSKVRMERLVINREASVEQLDSGNNKKLNVVYSQENSDTVLTAIINGFTRGFQETARAERALREKPFLSLFEAMHIALSDKNPEIKLRHERYFYDETTKTYHVNPYYLHNQFNTMGFNPKEMQRLLQAYGINLHESVFEVNPNYQSDLYNRLKTVYYDLKAASDSYLALVLEERIGRFRNARRRGDTLSFADRVRTITGLSAQIRELEGEAEANALRIETLKLERARVEDEARTAAHIIFSLNPVSDLLYLGQDFDVRKNDRYKSFARNYATFVQLAELQQPYSEYFSTGSVLVKGKPQYSYYLQNQMLTIAKLLEHGVQNVADFDRFPETRHLNPTRNPQYYNSWVMQQLFDAEGQRTNFNQLRIKVLTGLYTNDESGVKEEKKFSELSVEEKILMDYLLTTREGSSEIRRAEASNTAWRMALINTRNGSHDHVVPVIHLNEGFKDPQFLALVRGYIQAALWKFNDDGRTGKLGIFEDLFSAPTLQAIKDTARAKPQGYDWNRFFRDMEEELAMDYFGQSESFDFDSEQWQKEQVENSLFHAVESELIHYFETTAVAGKDSVMALMKRDLSTGSKRLLLDLANNFKGKTFGGDVVPSYGDLNQISALFQDPLFQDSVRKFVANDFIMAMEDSLLFFGDYTSYKDPIKRRKIIANNGVTEITGVDDAVVKKTLVEKTGLVAVYRQQKGLPEDTGKDFRTVRKTVLKDFQITSQQVSSGEMLQNLKDWYRAYVPAAKGLSDGELEAKILREKEVFKSFSAMEVADGAAYISLDLYKSLRKSAHTWFENEDKEFDRQKLLLKQKLGGELSQNEADFVNGGPYASFNVAKFALTGPVYEEGPGYVKPTFDKMGLKVLLPETDWDTKTHLFNYMLENTVDYAVYHSSSKGYVADKHGIWDEESFAERKPAYNYTSHAAGFMKLQQNTAAVKDKANFAIQLRGTFFTIMLLHKDNPKAIAGLKGLYHQFLTSLKDYITLSSQEDLAAIGLDQDGNFLKDEQGVVEGKRIFVNKIKEKLLEINDTDLSLIDQLNVDEHGDFVHFLEALPLQREIYNIVSGVLDQALRKTKLNGSKLYQTPEIGSGEVNVKMKKGTIGLKWHGLIRNEAGEIVGVSPVECKIAFKRNFLPLLELKDPDGKRVGTRERLNQLLDNEEWVAAHRDPLTMVGIRIPLQYLNFTSHMIVKEFLPESEGDSIIVPPEFYKQVGSDNDIDTITVSFRHLDKRTGKVLTKPKESYKEINDTINHLLKELDEAKVEDIRSSSGAQEIDRRIAELKKEFIEAEVYKDAGLSLADLEADFNISRIKSKTGGVDTLLFEGFRKGGLFRKLQQKNQHTELVGQLAQLNADMMQDYLNQATKEALGATGIDEAEHAEHRRNATRFQLSQAFRAKSNYIKGVSNDVVDPMMRFLSHPLAYGYLTETDSIDPINELAAEVQAMLTGEAKETFLRKWAEPKSALEDFSYTKNVVNHKNNFQVRSMLGSFVKFSRLLITLAQTETTLNQKYVSSGVDNLATMGAIAAQFKESGKGAQKFYFRHIWTPLLKSTPDGKLPISLRDEEGNIINKKLSMVATSLLDLFKNVDAFPSLNISWSNIKPLLFLLTEGVPFERAVHFLNNPVVQTVEETVRELGAGFETRHAIVKASQETFENKIHREPLSETDGGGYLWEDPAQPGKKNQMMRRHARAAEEYLLDTFHQNPASFKLDPEKIDAFTTAYAAYRRGLDIHSPQDLKAFLATPEGEPYREMATHLMAYYSTLTEDGDHFYKLVIKKLDRDANKYNNQAQIAEARHYEAALKNSRLLNPDFHDRIRSESVLSPYYHDRVVLNAISNIMPHLYNKAIPGWEEGVRNLIMDITGKMYGTSEDKRAMESRIMADLMDLITKNFYLIKWTGPDGKLVYNTLYEFFQKDIIPELGQLDVLKKLKDGGLNRDNLQNIRDLMGSENDLFLADYASFTNQPELFRAKYPELTGLVTLLQRLQTKRVAPYFKKPAPVQDDEESDEFLSQGYIVEDETRRPKRPKEEPPFTTSAAYNLFSQSYLELNLNGDAETRFIEEQRVREEWERLFQFDPVAYPGLVAALNGNTERLQFYKDNAGEVRHFAKLLAYYGLTKNSHMDRATGSLAYLAPAAIIRDVVETSFQNMEKLLSKESRVTVDTLLNNFEQLFTEMNASDRVQVKNKGEAYRMDKVRSGKLYSKIDNPKMRELRGKLREGLPQDAQRGFNNFLINPETTTYDNC